MKTTVVIDAAKLKRVMKLTGIRTCRKVIDFALDQAERLAQIERVFEGGFFLSGQGEIVDPQYDVQRMRASDRPKATKRKAGGHTN